MGICRLASLLLLFTICSSVAFSQTKLTEVQVRDLLRISLDSQKQLRDERDAAVEALEASRKQGEASQQVIQLQQDKIGLLNRLIAEQEARISEYQKALDASQQQTAVEHEGRVVAEKDADKQRAKVGFWRKTATVAGGVAAVAIGILVIK